MMAQTELRKRALSVIQRTAPCSCLLIIRSPATEQERTCVDSIGDTVYAEGRAGSEDLGGKRGLGGFLHSVRDVATRVVDDTTKEISKFERTLNQAHLLPSTKTFSGSSMHTIPSHSCLRSAPLDPAISWPSIPSL
jgi:hypothetical protein